MLEARHFIGTPFGLLGAVPLSNRVPSLPALMRYCLLSRCFPLTLRGTSSIVYVGNMGVIHTPVNGASRALNMDTFTPTLHLRMAEFACVVWWEYVPCPSNIADGGSRVGISCDLTRSAGISLRQVSFNLWPVSSPHAAPQVWAAWWRP